MSDQPQVPPTDPTEQYRIGGAPQPTEGFEIYGQKYESKQHFEAALAQQIRQYEGMKAQLEALQGQPSPSTPAPQNPGQPQRLTQEQLYEKFAKEGVDAANRAWFAQEVYGNPNAEINVGATVREIAATAVRAQQQVQELMLKFDHPEVNWDDPNTRKMVNEAVAKYGSVRGGIAVLQQEGNIPTRAAYEQWRSQQFQQTYGLQPQTQQPQPQQNSGYPVPVAPPPSVQTGGAPQARYDIQRIRERMDEIASLSNIRRTAAEDREFDQLATIFARETQPTR